MHIRIQLASFHLLFNMYMYLTAIKVENECGYLGTSGEEKEDADNQQSQKHDRNSGACETTENR